MRLALHSALFATLAFNIVFFVQELFLVLPKALVPGLEPVLFHNNHDWRGDDPIAELLQGTGALAILLLGLGLLIRLRVRGGEAASLRLLAAWLALSGLFQALPQVVIGAFVPMNDVGRAMSWLGMGAGAKQTAALAAVAAMAVAGRALAPVFAAFLPELGRSRAVLIAATLPALAAIPLILPFRVPGSIDQVVLVPVIMNGAAALFVQIGAIGRATPAPAPAGTLAPVVPLLAALAVVLVAFQIVLRPGIAF